jgi:DNA-binding transcriptional MocR family regulator
VAAAAPAELGLDLDRAGGRRYPLSRQLADELRRRVQVGALATGERLPTVRALASTLGVTPETVAAAYKQLTQQGYLRGEVGRGTFVAAPPLAAEEDPLAPFEAGGALPPFVTPDLAPSPPARRDLLRLASHPSVVSFAASVAAPELAPVRALREALAGVLDAEGASALEVCPTEGYPPLRAAVAALLRERGAQVDPATVCITNGCQQGIDLAAKVFLGPGDAVLAEQPSFLGALEAFRTRGVRVVGVPIEDDGLRTDVLPTLIERHRPKLLYCMPTYQNPTGRSLSAEKRRALLRIAAGYDLPIVEDDSAGFFHLDRGGPAPPALKAEDHAGYVIHLGTFSKLIGAGLRLGWLVAAPPVFDKLVAAKYASDLSSDALVQRAVHRLLESGTLIAAVREACLVYAERCQALVAALTRLGGGLRFDRPQGGFNLWLRLPPEGPTSTDLYLEAIQRGVAFVPGPFFFSAASAGSSSAAAARGLRLCYSALTPDMIERGVEQLGAALVALSSNDRARVAQTVMY